MAVAGNAFDIPLELRANDVSRRVLSIDSRFRSSSNSSTSNFYYRLQPPVKNVLRIRITTIEFPRDYRFFTVKRANVTLRVIYDRLAPKTVVLTIPEGNYTPPELCSQLNTLLSTLLPWLTVVYDSNTKRVTFTGTQPFAIDTTYDSIDRPFDYGLGYYLGFSHKSHVGVQIVDNYVVASNICVGAASDPYLLLKINEYDCVSHQLDDQTITAFAKIDFHEHAHHDHHWEVVFPNPQDLTRLHIQILDAYGDLMDLCGTQFSFSLEVLEVKNLSLYNTIRDSLRLQYT